MKNELERLEFLFGLYREYTGPLAMIEEKESRKAKAEEASKLIAIKTRKAGYFHS